MRDLGVLAFFKRKNIQFEFSSWKQLCREDFQARPRLGWFLVSTASREAEYNCSRKQWPCVIFKIHMSLPSPSEPPPSCLWVWGSLGHPDARPLPGPPVVGSLMSPRKPDKLPLS